jgi:aspartate/methionine/tyrosine aminotransferase
MSAAGEGSGHIRLALTHDDATTIEAFVRLGRAWRSYSPLAAGDDARARLVVI